MSDPAELAASFAADGFVVMPDVLSREACVDLRNKTASLVIDGAGARNLLDFSWCKDVANRLKRHPMLAAILPPHSVAVQCNYFEKSIDRNWLVPMHQDLSIPVKRQLAHPHLSGWSQKEGKTFVHPPETVLQEIVALRLHLEDCDRDDGPLRVVPGSHRLGRLGEQGVPAARAQSGEVVCAVKEGGVLAMRPLLLHASSRSMGTGKRRVLHFIFGPAVLPCGLEWP